MTDTAWESRVRIHGVASGTASRIIHLNTAATSVPSSHKIKQVKRIDEQDLAMRPEYFENAQERLEPKGDFPKEGMISSLTISFRRRNVWIYDQLIDFVFIFMTPANSIGMKKGLWVNDSGKIFTFQFLL